MDKFLLIGGGILLVGVFYRIYLNSKKRKLKRFREYLEEQKHSSKHKRPRNIEEHIIEIYEQLRSLKASMETKIKVVKILSGKNSQQIEKILNIIETLERRLTQLEEYIRKDREEDIFLKYARIYNMYKERKDIIEIAKETGYKPGEVELIVNLYRSSKGEDS